jgi:hypothetical protein
MEIHDVASHLACAAAPKGEAKRRRALPRIAEDPTRVPQHHFAGPDLPWQADLDPRFFGQDG